MTAAAPKPSTDGLSAAALHPDQVREILRQSSLNIPRFLFRGWSSSSGGDSDLNTTDQITPHALKNGDEERSIWQIDTEELVSSIIAHLGNKFEKSYASSWSASIPFARALTAIAKPAKPYLSIIDTKTLSDENFVYWCGSDEFKNIHAGHWPDEYHIFGPVRGSGYRALAAEELSQLLQPTMLTTYQSAPASDRDPLEVLVNETIRIGTQVGGYLGVVFAAHLLALCCNVTENEAVLDRLLDALPVHRDCIDESTDREKPVPAHPIPLAGRMVESKGWTETQNTNALLRALLRRQEARRTTGVVENDDDKSGGKGARAEVIVDDVVMQDASLTESMTAAKRSRGESKKTDRQPKEVRELRIDMKGEDERNKELE